MAYRNPHGGGFNPYDRTLRPNYHPQNGGNGFISSSQNGRSCFNCGVFGHFARECPQNSGGDFMNQVHNYGDDLINDTQDNDRGFMGNPQNGSSGGFEDPFPSRLENFLSSIKHWPVSGKIMGMEWFAKHEHEFEEEKRREEFRRELREETEREERNKERKRKREEKKKERKGRGERRT